MIAVDTNLLIYAHREDSEFHEIALHSLVRLGESDQRWSIPWPCVHEFLAIVTHPRVFSEPTPMSTALNAIDTWIDSPACETIAEEPGYSDVLARLLKEGKITGPRVHDARIAALCVHHGVLSLWTADRDFSRFPEVRTHNPLVES